MKVLPTPPQRWPRTPTVRLDQHAGDVETKAKSGVTGGVWSAEEAFEELGQDIGGCRTLIDDAEHDFPITLSTWTRIWPSAGEYLMALPSRLSST